VHLHIGDTAQNGKPIEERLAAVRAGSRDPTWRLWYFSSVVTFWRPAAAPAASRPTCRAFGTENVLPPWGSKYTININTEMNYGPVEVCNLPECAQPLFDMIQDISETGAKTAKVYYRAGGWVAHHNLDLLARNSAGGRGAIWHVASWRRLALREYLGALCLWRRGRFSQEVLSSLKKVRPQFLMDIMIVEPKHHWLVTPFSMSPEHGYFDADGKPAVLSPVQRWMSQSCATCSRIASKPAESSVWTLISGPNSAAILAEKFLLERLAGPSRAHLANASWSARGPTRRASAWSTVSDPRQGSSRL